jgi:hypothetical protein
LGVLLAYNYTVGQRLLYVHSSKFEGGAATFEHLQEVLGEREGIWDLRISQRMLQREGSLSVELPPQLLEHTQTVRMNAQGVVFDEAGQALSEPIFPSQRMEAGATWSSNGATYRLEGLEIDEDTQVALFLAEMQPQGARVYSWFSVTDGCLLRSDTVLQSFHMTMLLQDVDVKS